MHGSEEPSGHALKVLISRRERSFSPLDVEMIDQLLTLEVLRPCAQWIMRPTEKVHCNKNLESVFG